MEALGLERIAGYLNNFRTGVEWSLNPPSMIIQNLEQDPDAIVQAIKSEEVRTAVLGLLSELDVQRNANSNNDSFYVIFPAGSEDELRVPAVLSQVVELYVRMKIQHFYQQAFPDRAQNMLSRLRVGVWFKQEFTELPNGKILFEIEHKSVVISNDSNGARSGRTRSRN